MLLSFFHKDIVMKILEIERLILRELTQADYNALSLILQDEKAMYAYEHAFSDKETQEWLDRQLARYANDGFGLWAVTLKESGAMIGQCGLTYQVFEGKQVVEIGYLLQREFWHNGYATEAAIACKRYAFDTLRLDKVYSIIRDNNHASQAVAIRNAMSIEGSFVKNYHGIDMLHIVYAATRK